HTLRSLIKINSCIHVGFELLKGRIHIGQQVSPRKLFTRNGFEADHQVNGDESDEANNNHLPGIYGLLRERSALPDIGLNNPQGAATVQIIGYLFKKDTSGP